MRQIFYHSRAAERVDVGSIMASSKRNNGMDGITGLLVFDGQTFLQVLEGPRDSVSAAFDRIQADPRHRDVTVIRDDTVADRDFAYWSMELRDPNHPSDDAMWRLRRRLEHFDLNLQRYFFGEASA